MTTPDDAHDDESGPPLDATEEQALRELGDRLQDDDPRLAGDLSSGREALFGAGSAWRRRLLFGAAVGAVVIGSSALLVLVGVGGGIGLVVAFVAAGVALSRIRG